MTSMEVEEPAAAASGKADSGIELPCASLPTPPRAAQALPPTSAAADANQRRRRRRRRRRSDPRLGDAAQVD